MSQADKNCLSKDTAKLSERAVSSLSNPSVTSDSNHKSIESSVSNTNILRDIEQLIENMEQNQAKQNENMLKNVEDLLGNILAKQQSSRPVSVMSNKSTTPVIDTNSGMNNDVRNFVSEHIQDISPDLLGQVTNELFEQTSVTEILSNPQISRPVSAMSNRNDVYAKSRSPEIINDVRNFVSENIQSITPELLGQVTNELFENTSVSEMLANQQLIPAAPTNLSLIFDNGHPTEDTPSSADVLEFPIRDLNKSQDLLDNLELANQIFQRLSPGRFQDQNDDQSDDGAAAGIMHATLQIVQAENTAPELIAATKMEPTLEITQQPSTAPNVEPPKSEPSTSNVEEEEIEGTMKVEIKSKPKNKGFGKSLRKLSKSQRRKSRIIIIHNNVESNPVPQTVVEIKPVVPERLPSPSIKESQKEVTSHVVVNTFVQEQIIPESLTQTSQNIEKLDGSSHITILTAQEEVTQEPIPQTSPSLQNSIQNAQNTEPLHVHATIEDTPTEQTQEEIQPTIPENNIQLPFEEVIEVTSQENTTAIIDVDQSLVTVSSTINDQILELPAHEQHEIEEFAEALTSYYMTDPLMEDEIPSQLQTIQRPSIDNEDVFDDALTEPQSPTTNSPIVTENLEIEPSSPIAEIPSNSNDNASVNETTIQPQTITKAKSKKVSRIPVKRQFSSRPSQEIIEPVEIASEEPAIIDLNQEEEILVAPEQEVTVADNFDNAYQENIEEPTVSPSPKLENASPASTVQEEPATDNQTIEIVSPEDRNSQELEPTVSATENSTDIGEANSSIPLSLDLNGEASSSHPSANGAATPKDVIKSTQNLSELVENTQRLIQQMKDEIASDIADSSFVSEDDSYDRDDYSSEDAEWSDEDYDDQYYEDEELEDEELEDEEDIIEELNEEEGEESEEDVEISNSIIENDERESESETLQSLSQASDGKTESIPVETLPITQQDSDAHPKSTPVMEETVNKTTSVENVNILKHEIESEESGSEEEEEYEEEASVGETQILENVIPVEQQSTPSTSEASPPSSKISGSDIKNQATETEEQSATSSQFKPAITASNKQQLPIVNHKPKDESHVKAVQIIGNLLSKQISKDLTFTHQLAPSTQASTTVYNPPTNSVSTSVNEAQSTQQAEPSTSKTSAGSEKPTTSKATQSKIPSFGTKKAEKTDQVSTVTKTNYTEALLNPSSAQTSTASLHIVKLEIVDKVQSASSTEPSTSASSKSKEPASSGSGLKANKNEAKPTNIKNSSDNGQDNKKNGGRKNSTPTPFGTIRTSNILAIQKELFNKSATNSPGPSKPNVNGNKKPAPKVSPQTKQPNKTVSTLANKLTKLITPSTSSDSKKIKDNPKLEVKSKSQADLKIPKKKYHETCFSDDYQTTDDEEERNKTPELRKPINSLSFIINNELFLEAESDPDVSKCEICCVQTFIVNNYFFETKPRDQKNKTLTHKNFNAKTNNRI
jgi:hypothetical protein